MQYISTLVSITSTLVICLGNMLFVCVSVADSLFLQGWVTGSMKNLPLVNVFDMLVANIETILSHQTTVQALTSTRGDIII